MGAELDFLEELNGSQEGWVISVIHKQSEEREESSGFMYPCHCVWCSEYS